jgi:hypothetical protein
MRCRDCLRSDAVLIVPAKPPPTVMPTTGAGMVHRLWADVKAQRKQQPAQQPARSQLEINAEASAAWSRRAAQAGKNRAAFRLV